MFILIVYIWSTLFGYVKAFHGYNDSLIKVDKSTSNLHCQSYYNATRPYDKTLNNKLKLWNVFESRGHKINGETLYGSSDSLELIWKNQHPSNCSDAKYVISTGWTAGFGSRFHTESWGLALAMELGRVYLPHPYG